MKILLRPLIIALFLSITSSALLKSSMGSDTPRERIDFDLNDSTKHNLKWGAIAGGPAAMVGLLTQVPGRDIVIKKNQLGRQLRMGQTFLRANINQNRQLLSEVDEMVTSGEILLDQMLEGAMRKINVLRSDIEIMFNNPQ